MVLCNLLLTYLLVGVVFGVVSYVFTWRAFRQAGRSSELAGNLLEKSVCWHAVAWPSPAFWCLLLLLVSIWFPKQHK